MKTTLALLLAFFVAVATAVEAPPRAITRAWAIDGDTVRVQFDGGSTASVRLAGVDAPETTRARCAAERRAGEAAKQFTAEWLARPGALTLTARGQDKYRRVLGRIARGGDDLSAALLKAGHARPYTSGKRRGWC